MSGKRAAGRATVAIPGRAYLLGAGGVLALVAWGALVWIAISYGGSARSGHASSWALLAASAVGAVACLFLALLLGTRTLEALGVLEPRGPHRH